MEIRGPSIGGDDQTWLTPEGLVAMYPLVGALLAELKKTERRERVSLAARLKSPL